MIDIYEIEDDYKKYVVKRDYFNTTLKLKKRSLLITSVKIKDFKEVHEIWVRLANEMQTSARTHIENIVTMAIQTVFQKPFQFKLVFKEQRNNVTCTPIVVLDGNEYSPKDQMGGGMADIIGFALRITLWSMRTPRSRNIFILDEPFRFCGDLTLKASMMLKKLSERLKFQVLLVTHDSDLKEMCDRVWVIHNRKFSKVKIINKIIETVNRKIRRR